MRSERQPDLVERHLVGEVALAGREQPVLLGTREVVIAKQRGGPAVVRCPGARQVLRKWLGSGELLQRELPQLRDEGQLAAGAHRGVAREHLLDQRRARARKTHDENRLRHLCAQRRLRQQLDVRADEEALQTREERLDGLCVVGEPAGFGCQQSLALDQVAPCFVVAAEPIEQPTSFEPRIAVECRRSVEDSQRFAHLARSRKVIGAQQLHVIVARDALGPLQQVPCSSVVVAHLAQLRPVRERAKLAGRKCVRARKAGLRFVGATLLHEIERQVREERRLLAAQLQRAPEVPFSGGQVVQLRKDRAEQVVALRIERIDAQRSARERLGVGMASTRIKQLGQLVISPVRARVAFQHRLERFGRGRDLALAALFEVASLQRMSWRRH